jgi:ribonuclease P protein component
MVETYLKEEDKKVVTNYQRKKLDKRLKKQKDFDLVFRKGKRIHAKSLTLLYLESDCLKFGISLSKKHGKAVVRNRIKRLIRAAFKSYIKNISKSFYIIILPRISDDYNYNNFDKDILYSLKKGNIIND